MVGLRATSSNGDGPWPELGFRGLREELGEEMGNGVLGFPDNGRGLLIDVGGRRPSSSASNRR
jgi:hypothetical protein